MFTLGIAVRKGAEEKKYRTGLRALDVRNTRPTTRLHREEMIETGNAHAEPSRTAQCIPQSPFTPHYNRSLISGIIRGLP